MKFIAIILAAVGIAYAANDTTWLDTIVTARFRTPAMSPLYASKQVSVSSLRRGNGNFSSPIPVLAPNMDDYKASGRIASDYTIPTTETLASISWDSTQGGVMVIPAGWLVANRVRQATLTLRLGVNIPFPTSGLVLNVRANSTAQGAGLDGVLVASCAINLESQYWGIQNKNHDVTVTMWLTTRLGAATLNAIPTRSHTNWTMTSLSYNQSTRLPPAIPFGGAGYEVQATVDNTINDTLYLSYKWEAASIYRSISAIPTDGSEWVIGGTDAVFIPWYNPTTNSQMGYLHPVPIGTVAGGSSAYGLGCSQSTCIVGLSSGMIRVSTNGPNGPFGHRATPQTASPWYSVLWAPWIGTNGRWIMASGAGHIITSDNDGNTWTSRTSPTASKINHCDGSSAVGIQCAVDSAGARLTSADGITWTKTVDRTGLGTPKWVTVNPSNAVVYWGTTGRISYSTDGAAATFTDKTTGIGSSSFVSGSFDATLGLWLGVTTSGSYSASAPSTTTWTAGTGISTSTITAMACSGTGYCNSVTSDGMVWQTSNGTSWTNQTTIPNGHGYLWGDRLEYRL